MLDLAPARLPPRSPVDRPGVFPANGERKRRVALLRGCAQSVLDPGINEAAIRLLNRSGVEVVLAEGEGCCGALVHHMGRATRRPRGRAAERRRLDARDRRRGPRRHPRHHVGLRHDRQGLRLHAAHRSRLRREGRPRLRASPRTSRSTSKTLDLGTPSPQAGLTVAYHAACSLQHGQQIKTAPKTLLARAGFTVREPAEAHLCCGSAGTYNMLQPEISAPPARPQGRQHRGDRRRHRRRRQHRLPRPDRRRHRPAGRPHGRAARLGLRRAEAGAARRLKPTWRN